MSSIILGTPAIPLSLHRQDRILNDSVCPDCEYRDDRPSELRFQQLRIDPEIYVEPTHFNGLRGALIGACSLTIGRGEATSAILSGTFERAGLGESRSIQSLIRQTATGAFVERNGLTLNLDHTVTSRGKIISLPDSEIPVGNQLASSVALAEMVRDLKALGVYLFDLSEVRASDGGQLAHTISIVNTIVEKARLGQPLVFPGLEADTAMSNAFNKLAKVIGSGEWAEQFEVGLYSPDVSLRPEVAQQVNILQEKLPGLQAGSIRIVGVLEPKNRIIANAYNEFANDYIARHGEDAIIEGTFKDVVRYIPEKELESGVVSEEDVKNFFSKFINKRGRGDAIIREKAGNIGIFNTTYRELVPVGPEQGILFRETDYTQPEESWDIRTRILLRLNELGDVIPRAAFNKVLKKFVPVWEGSQIETFMSSYLDVIDPQFTRMKFISIGSEELLDHFRQISFVFNNFKLRQQYLLKDPQGREELMRMFGYNQLPFELRRKGNNGPEFQFEAYRESLIIIMSEYLADFRARISRSRSKDD
jgi:hypothetical protein